MLPRNSVPPLFRLLSTVATIFVLVVLRSAPFPEAISAESKPSQDAVACGPNALVMYLTLSGVPIPLDVIDRSQSRRQGSSLMELCRDSESVGVLSEVRHYKVEEFDRMPMPAIVQMKESDGGYHFSVIYGKTREGFTGLDGSTAECFNLSRERLGRVLTGYALVPRRTSTRWVRFFTGLLDHPMSYGLLFIDALVIYGIARKATQWLQPKQT